MLNAKDLVSKVISLNFFNISSSKVNSVGLILGGATNITFNIQANDVRGIRELLIDNRATIINLVNQGANAKGKSNIV